MSYRTHDEHRAQMRKLSFNDLVAQNRVVGDAGEMKEKIAQVTDQLFLTDLAGNFELGCLPPAQTAAALRGFIDNVVAKTQRIAVTVYSVLAVGRSVLSACNARGFLQQGFYMLGNPLGHEPITGRVGVNRIALQA